MLEIINTRRSVRKWKNDPVAKDDIMDILEAGMNAPSAGNQQAWRFIVLEAENISAYREINSNCPKGAPVGILVCGDTSREKYPGYYVQDCSAALQNILLAIHSKNLGGVWSTVFPQNADNTRKLLNMPGHIMPVGFVAFGIPEKLGEDVQSRYTDEFVHWNKW